VRRRSCARNFERELPPLRPRVTAARMPTREGDCHWEIFHPKDVVKLRAWLSEQVSSVVSHVTVSLTHLHGAR
jgi:hypothetical protein